MALPAANQTLLQKLATQPKLAIKLRSESYVKFDGTEMVTLQNAFCDQALRIKYDILLIVYELIDWKPIQELIAPWPPDDQQKILNYLQMFYEAQLIEVEGEPQQGGPTQGTNPKGTGSSYNKVPINVENHHNMLKDSVRMAAYRRAIERTVQAGDVVLDVGSGSGVLSFFAAQAGARQVVGIERQAHVADLAEALARANQLTNVQFLQGLSTQIHPQQLPDGQPADVLVAEIIGDGILEENILEYTLDVRRRLLKPGARMVPQKLAIEAFAFHADVQNQYWRENQEYSQLYGIDFSLLGQVLCNKAMLRRERYHTQLYRKLSEPVRLYELDFRELQEPTFKAPIRLPMLTDATLSGICLYFRAWLDDTTVLTNSPWGPQTHWSHLLYHLAEPLAVTKDSVFEAELIYDGALRIGLLQGV